MGHFHEIKNFLGWYNALSGYRYKAMIAGNHDFGFQNFPEEVRELIDRYPNVTYLEDSMTVVDGIKIWGSPWQPWFLDWAFNLPRGGELLKAKWDMIPENVDILITHGPPHGTLDVVERQVEHLGCELLTERLKIVKPKIHIFGHIHSGQGIVEKDGTLFVNASVLNEQYRYQYQPFTIDFDFVTRKWEVVTE